MSLCVAATSLIIGLHAVSFHTDTKSGYNNVNPGIYAGYNSYVVGTYYNSDRKQSVYVGKVFETESCRFDMTVGAVTGYAAPVLPFVIAGVKFDTDQVVKNSRTRISMMPVIDKNKKFNGMVFHLSIERSF